MERSGSCWVRPSVRREEKKASEQSKQSPPPPFLSLSLSSLVRSPVTLNRGLTFSRGHPWLAVKRSGINVWVEGRESGAGAIGWSGWGRSALVNDWHSFWWSADMADSPSLLSHPPCPLPAPSSPLVPSLSPSISLSPPPPPPPTLLSFPPILSGLIVLHLFIQAFMAASSSCRPISPPGWWVPSPSYRGYLLSASIHITFLWLWEDGFHIGPLYRLAV